MLIFTEGFCVGVASDIVEAVVEIGTNAVFGLGTIIPVLLDIELVDVFVCKFGWIIACFELLFGNNGCPLFD